MPLKLSVIKNKAGYSGIVSQISRYANTQNKVNDADFTANNPFLIELEKLSRYILTPATERNNLQTNWFFERAKGQYKNIRQKDGFTKSRQKQFDLKYPKGQMFTKVELAKYVNAYQEVWEGKRLVIVPHIVVKGNEKNYAQFINNNTQKKINSIYFEDTMAKIIIFKTAERLYGVKPNSIGEMRNAVVPYAIALLGHLTNYRLDLYKIWKNQIISDSLSHFMLELMKKLNQFIIDNSPSSHYIEWAKKEECWTKIKESVWTVNIAEIERDMADDTQIAKRQAITETEDVRNQQQYELELLKSIPPSLWREIETWGKESKFLSINHQTIAFEMAGKIKYNRTINDQERSKAMKVYDIVCANNIDLLAKAEELQSVEIEPTLRPIEYSSEITMELVRQMVEWDRRRKTLKNWQWDTMKGILDGKFPLSDKYIYGCWKNLETLKKNGFIAE